MTANWQLTGARTQLWGLKFNGGKVSILGGHGEPRHSLRIRQLARPARDHREDRHERKDRILLLPRSTAVDLRGGHAAGHGQVAHGHPRGGAPISPRFIRILLVRRNHFTGFLDRPTGNYGSGQTDFIEVGETGSDYPTAFTPFITIQSNLFDDNPETSGVVDVKVSGVTLKGNTLQNCPGGKMDMRYGHNSRMESNWFSATSGSVARVYGKGHVLIGNRMGGSAFISVCSGTQSSNSWLPQEHQRADSVKCLGNYGTHKIGDTQGVNGATLGALATRIEAPQGPATVHTQQDYAGIWNTPTGGLIESGATYSGIASETFTVPTAALPASAVGINAIWINET